MKNTFRIIYAIMIFCLATGLTIFHIAESAVYDLKGNKYSNVKDIVYYSPNGERFIADNERFQLTSLDSDTIIKGRNAYINENGYLVKLETNNITIHFDKNSKSPYSFFDNEGNRYADPFVIKWNKDGIIIYR